MSNKYIITQYSYDRAKELGLKIKLSQFTTKKLDVYKDNVYINSIGDSRYSSRLLSAYSLLNNIQ